MAVGKIPYVSTTGRTADEEITATWRTNFFFFFNCASQSFLWPWIPQILRDSGLTRTESGLAMGLIISASLLSVFAFLHSLKKTRSGALRRLLLFSFSVISIFFNISAILVLPSSSSQPFCHSAVDSFASYPGNAENSHPITYQVSNTTSEVHHPGSTEANFSPLDTEEIAAVHPNGSKKIKNKDAAKESFITNTTIATYIHTTSTTASSTTTVKPVHSTRTHKHSWPKRKHHPHKSLEPQLLPPEIDGKLRQNNTISNTGNKTELNEIIEDHSPTRNDDAHEQNNPYYDNLENIDDKVKSDSDVEPYTRVTPIKLYTRKENEDVAKKHHIFPPGIMSDNNKENRSTYLAVDFSEFPPEEEYPSPPYNYYDLTASDKLSPQRPIPNSDSITDRQNIFPKFRARNQPIIDDDISNERHIERYKRGIYDTEFKKEDNYSSNVAWGIAILLIIGTLLGGGIEASVSQLWYCYRYGATDEKSSVDAVEATIRPTFRLCVLGEYRNWSLLTCSLCLMIPTIFIGIACHMGVIIYSPFTLCAAFHLLSATMSWAGLLIISIPYGNLQESRMRHPLSLYLDDEVLKEGLRRVGFHSWMFIMGFLVALPTLYTLWLLKETSENDVEVFVAQTVSIVGYYFGEGCLYLGEKWIGRKLNIPGLMVTSGFLLALQNFISWAIFDLRIIGGSLLLTGYTVSLMWIASRNSALLLGTTYDQEKEAWCSWTSHKVGLALGALIWAGISDTEWSSNSIKKLSLVSGIISIVCSTVILLIGILIRSRGERRRRIYHTLDLNIVSDDDTDATSPEEDEEDWLVKRAKKEGIRL